jgi:hypothetical protein
MFIRQCDPLHEYLKPLFDEFAPFHGCNKIALIRQMPLNFCPTLLVIVPISRTSQQGIPKDKNFRLIAVPVPKHVGGYPRDVSDKVKVFSCRISRSINIHTTVFVDYCKSPEVADGLGADGLAGVLNGLADFLAEFMTDELVDVVVGDDLGCEVAGGCAFVEVLEAEFDDGFAMPMESLVPDYPQCVG